MALWMMVCFLTCDVERQCKHAEVNMLKNKLQYNYYKNLFVIFVFCRVGGETASLKLIIAGTATGSSIACLYH